MARIFVGIVAIPLFIWLGWIATNWGLNQFSLLNVSAGVSAGESATLYATGHSARLYIACRDNTPRRLIITWIMPYDEVLLGGKPPATFFTGPLKSRFDDEFVLTLTIVDVGRRELLTSDVLERDVFERFKLIPISLLPGIFRLPGYPPRADEIGVVTLEQGFSVARVWSANPRSLC